MSSCSCSVSGRGRPERQTRPQVGLPRSQMYFPLIDILFNSIHSHYDCRYAFASGADPSQLSRLTISRFCGPLTLPLNLTFAPGSVWRRVGERGQPALRCTSFIMLLFCKLPPGCADKLHAISAPPYQTTLKLRASHSRRPPATTMMVWISVGARGRSGGRSKGRPGLLPPVSLRLKLELTPTSSCLVGNSISRLSHRSSTSHISEPPSRGVQMSCKLVHIDRLKNPDQRLLRPCDVLGWPPPFQHTQRQWQHRTLRWVLLPELQLVVVPLTVYQHARPNGTSDGQRHEPAVKT